MENNKPYRVVSSKFIGRDEFNGHLIGFTYEITFNRSLEHTGKFTGISDGLNAYDKKEARTSFIDSFMNVWYTFIAWLKS